MSDRIKYEKIEKIKQQIVDYSLIIGSSIGGLAYLLSLFKFSGDSFNLSHFTDLIVLSGFIIIALLRNKIPFKIKVSSILTGLLSFIILGVYDYGFYSDSKILLILIPFFSVLAFSLRKIIFIYVISVISILFLGYLHYAGYIISPDKFSVTMVNWGIKVALYSAIAFILLVITVKFNSGYDNLLNALLKSNKETLKQEQSYKEIFNSSGDAIIIQSLKGEIIDANTTALKMYQYSSEEFENVTIEEISSGTAPYNMKTARLNIKKALKNGKIVFDWQAKKKNGEVFWVEVSIKKTFIAGEERLLSLVRDINEKKRNQIELNKYKMRLEEIVKQRTSQLTNANKELQLTNKELINQREELTSILEELKSTQDHLVHSEKMASLGVLAAGVAHEINNPLNFIQGGINAIESYYENETDNEKLPDDLNFILQAMKKGVSRAANIVTSLNHFSRRQQGKNENCNLHSIINNCLIMLENSYKNKIKITKDFTQKKYELIGNEGKLHQVMINILKNAEQAIEKTGNISIKTRINDNWFHIFVQDNGCGITKENIDKITDPFYTTKPPGQGTGLGLSISYNIIKEHGGELNYISETGQGTTAHICLPLKEKEIELL